MAFVARSLAGPAIIGIRDRAYRNPRVAPSPCTCPTRRLVSAMQEAWPIHAASDVGLFSAESCIGSPGLDSVIISTLKALTALVDAAALRVTSLECKAADVAQLTSVFSTARRCGVFLLCQQCDGRLVAIGYLHCTLSFVLLRRISCFLGMLTAARNVVARTLCR